MTEPDVSIVIVNWNTREILRDCLRSIDMDAGAISCEIIVVDNASVDGSAAMVKQEFPRVHLIENDENRGFAAANNQGMAVARARYILLLNSDTIVLDSAAAKTVAFADAHPEAAVVGCRILNSDRTWQPSCSMFPSAANMLLSVTYLYKLLPQNRLFGREHMTWWDGSDSREVDLVSGCFMLVRREAIEQVGVMDEGYFMYAEETDWCFRFKQDGWKVLFTPDAQIIHLGGKSSEQAPSEMTLQLRSGILQFFRKHRSLPAYWGACLLTAVWYGVRAPYWLFRGLMVSRGRDRSWQTARLYARGFFRSFGGWTGLAYKNKLSGS